MKRKILWLGLSFLLVAALVLASCAPAVPSEQEEEEEEEEEKVGPQYGGTLTHVTYRTEEEPTTWDQADGSWTLGAYTSPYMEPLVLGDVEKYGEGYGTGEFTFELNDFIPEKYLEGQLCESWEVSDDPLGVIFNIRRGIMWQANSHIGFEPREYTAYDGAFCMNRARASAYGNNWLTYMPKEGAFEAVGRYTLFAHFDKFSASWPLTLGFGYFSLHYPEEVVEAGAADWKNQTGTGPFILEEFVKGSYVSYTRNPDWWNKEHIVNGKKYDVPFVDKLVFPIIVDESTKIAAIRTGMADLTQYVRLMYRDTLASTCPDLILDTYRSANFQQLRFMCTSGPFTDKNLRRALMIGTDLRAIVKSIHTEGDIQCFPWNPASGADIYTPIEDLPAAARELFTYDPEKAKQMIIDAGYPEGLEIEVDYSTWGVMAGEMAAMLEDQWAKIGVTTTLKPHDQAVLLGLSGSGDYKYAMIGESGNAPEVSRLDSFRVRPWLLFYDDEWYNDQVDKCMAEEDETKHYALLKELGIYVIDQVTTIPLGGAYLLCCYWPWVKNFYGAYEIGYENHSTMNALIWIDQNLKAEMGY